RVALGDVCANDDRFFGRVDHRLDRIEELATALQDGGLDRAWSVGLPLWCVGDRLPVHTLATDPVEEEPSAAPPLEPERAALGTSLVEVPVHDGAPRRVARIARLGRAVKVCAQRRAEA